MAGIRRGLYFGGTVPLAATPKEAAAAAAGTPEVEDPNAENSDGDVPFATTNNKKAKFSHGQPMDDGYNSDDNRLIYLKTQGYTNDAVAKKLVEEGRVRLAPTTVGGRFLRLKKIAEEKENEILDDELSDWHIGEDDVLQEAVTMMNEKYEADYQRLMERKWRDVSDIVAAKLDIKKYTGKACKERWEGLQNGSALEPIELDSDQEGRAVVRQERIAAAKKRRHDAKAAAQAEKDAIEAQKVAKLEDKKAKAEQKEEERKAREADRAETLRLREEKKRGKEMEKALLDEAKQLWMKEVHETRRIRQLEERYYRHITGKQLNRMRHLNTFDDANVEDEDIALDFNEENDDEEGYITDAELDTDIAAENDPTDIKDVTSDREEDKCASPITSDHNIPTAAPMPAPTKAKVTAETLANPRSVLTDAELEVLLFQRGLPRRTQRETHPQVVARLAAADEALTAPAVSALLEKHFDRSKGSKVDKVRRLQQHDADKSAAGASGAKSTDPAFKMRYEGYQGKFAELIR